MSKLEDAEDLTGVNFAPTDYHLSCLLAENTVHGIGYKHKKLHNIGIIHGMPDTEWMLSWLMRINPEIVNQFAWQQGDPGYVSVKY